MTTLSRYRRIDLSLAMLGIILLMVGAVVLFWSGSLAKSWYYAPLPPKLTFKPYITANAEVAPAIDFSPGLPKMQIAFDDFVKRSQGKPYLVTFWSGWKTDDPTYSPRFSWYKVVYSMLATGPTGERHLYTMEEIPNYASAYAPGYSTETAFDPKTNEFYLKVTGTHYGMLVMSLVLLIIGGLIFACGIWISGEVVILLKRRAV